MCDCSDSSDANHVFGKYFASYDVHCGFCNVRGWKGGSRIDPCAVLVGKHFTPRRNACKSTVRTLGFHDGQG